MEAGLQNFEFAVNFCIEEFCFNEKVLLIGRTIETINIMLFVCDN